MIVFITNTVNKQVLLNEMKNVYVKKDYINH